MHVIEFPPYNRCNNLVAGISAVVGVIGGVYLLTSGVRNLLDKITDRKTKKQIDEETFCNVCCQEIEAQNAKSCVTCCLCNKRICRNGKCSNWLPKSAQWECQLCHSSKESLAQTSSWVAEQMSFNQQKYVYPMRARSEIYIPISDFHDNASSIHFESASQLGVNMNTITAEQKLKIREYVEEVVANMLGGSLDQIRVGQISKSENYLPSIANGRHNATTAHAANNNSNQLEFSAMSQTRLRQLIESIIAETLRMPALTGGTVSELALNRHAQSNGSATLPLVNGNVRRHRTEHYFEPKIYQDLLATAVLNKIVDNQGNVRQLSESTPDLSARNIDPNYNVENQSTTSGSSVEPRSDCSYTDTEQPPQIGKVEQLSPFDSERNRYVDDADNLISAGRESALSDYIASHMVPLPDLSTNVTESEEDDRVSVTSSAPGEGTWEDNWLFKKKRPSLSASIATGSVGMLVPAPKEDVRAQIGDKTTDEISDLSEMGSDTDDSLDMLRGNLDPLNDRLLSKQLIGGQNTKIVLDELIERASLVSNTALAADEPQFTETKNEHLVETATRTKAINTDVDKLQIEELDMGLLSPPTHFKDTNSKLATTAQNGSSGSVAERECKKWDNAVDMPNNPYAPEELKKRISGSQERFMDVPSISPTSEQIAIIKANTEADAKAAEEEVTRENYKRYSRDYYINEDSQNSSRRQTDNSISPNISDDPSTDIAINEAVSASPTAIAQSQQFEQSNALPTRVLYQALPAQVVEENASLETLSNQSLQSVNTTTSDDSDTVRVYDFKKQETTIIRDARAEKEGTATTNLTGRPQSAQETTIQQPLPKVRPTELTLDTVSGAALGARTPITPTRGSTPTAFKFLQPKRKLIEPSQVLSFDENDAQPSSPPGEKTAVEEEVAQVLPSVKALAQAFLLTSNKCTQAEKRWKAKIKSLPSTPSKPTEVEQIKVNTPLVSVKSPEARKFETSPSVAEIAEDATIASDLSSLETDPPIHQESEAKEKDNLPTIANTQQTPKEAGKVSPNAMRRSVGLLRSNIAFFENLKFK